MKSKKTRLNNRAIIGLIFLFAVSMTVPLTIMAAGAAKWGTKVQEALNALTIEGDVEDGEDVFEICAACHLPSGWGDPPGTFPQLAGQHATVLIKQIADIRAGNRDNPTMYPFAIQIEGEQDLADASAYMQTLKMNPSPTRGPAGTSFLLSNLRKDLSDYSLDSLEKTVGGSTFKKLKKLEEQDFKTKKSFQDTIKKTIGAAAFKKHGTLITKTADWTSDLKLGKRLYEKNCVQCHGDHGQGSYKDYYPVIAGQTYLYLVRQFHWIKVGKRRNANPDMVKQIKGFSDLDMRSVVDYASRFKMRPGDWKKIVTDDDDDDDDE